MENDVQIARPLPGSNELPWNICIPAHLIPFSITLSTIIVGAPHVADVFGSICVSLPRSTTCLIDLAYSIQRNSLFSIPIIGALLIGWIRLIRHYRYKLKPHTGWWWRWGPLFIQCLFLLFIGWALYLPIDLLGEVVSGGF